MKFYLYNSHHLGSIYEHNGEIYFIILVGKTWTYIQKIPEYFKKLLVPTKISNEDYLSVSKQYLVSSIGKIGESREIFHESFVEAFSKKSLGIILSKKKRNRIVS